MKKYKRIVALLLGGLMLASAATSCSESGTNTEETEAAPVTETEVTVEEVEEEEDTYIYDDLPDSDFNGYGYRILSCNFYNKELATYLTFDEITGDPIDDKLYDSRLYLEDRFNIAISWIETGDTTAGLNAAKNSINGGDDAFDILIGHDHNTIGLGKEGYLYNMFDVEQFNFDKPWWPEFTVESLRFGDKLYAASSYLSYCGLHWTRVITVNKDYADELTMEIPYDMVREGTWTLDALYSLTEGSSIDVDGNGKINAKDKVALTSGAQTWYCMQLAVDLPIYRKDENGVPYLDLDVERADKYVTIMRNLIGGDDYLASGDFGIDVFKEGNALFAYTQVGDAYDYYRISDVRYGFLPTPKLDELQESYINGCTDVPWGIPKTVSGDQLDIVGTVTEAMSCYNYNNVLPAYYETAIKARAADAPDDTEMLTIIADTRTIGFAYSYNLTFNNICSDCVEGTQEVASYFKKAQKVADKTLTKLIAAFEDME